ncbi:MAG: LysM peptidoglycan-binding domain-containing protein [Actinobacteria bacterium]|nr:LysM peptidoglycan-binding domain-containing protein [Actinomycetota bacterium]
MTDISSGSVRISPSAQGVVEDHAFSRIDVEVGGFLLGRIRGDDTEIVSAKPALTAESNQTHLTITHEAWAEILEVMDSDFPGLSIVGWYHTHPGFGLFLSDYDVFIQQNFFGSQGQIAMVIDPLIGEFGYFVAHDDVATQIGGGATARPAAASPGVERTQAVAAVRAGSARSGRVSWKAPVVAVAVTAVLVGSGAWFVGSMQGQDAGRSVATGELAAVDAQVSQLQGLLASAEAQAPPLQAPSAEAPAAVPGLVLQSGDPVSVVVAYIVRDGDSWWRIAQRQYGEGSRFRELQDANPAITVLEPGLELKIPQNALIQQGATVVTP